MKGYFFLLSFCIFTQNICWSIINKTDMPLHVMYGIGNGGTFKLGPGERRNIAGNLSQGLHIKSLIDSAVKPISHTFTPFEVPNLEVIFDPEVSALIIKSIKPQYQIAD